MRICLLATLFQAEPGSDSGIGLVYRTLADGLAAEGHAVHVVHPTPRPEPMAAAFAALSPRWTYDIVPAGLPGPLRLLAGNGPWQRRALFECLWTARRANAPMAAACASRAIEIIETHAFAAPALHFLRRKKRPPVVSRLATTTTLMAAESAVSSRAMRWMGQAERKACFASDALVSHSAANRDEVCALEGYDPRQVALIPLGIPDPGAPSPIDSGEEVNFLFVGRFEPRKGIDVLLAAIPGVAEACPKSRFVLAGNPAGSPAWQSFIAQYPELARSRVRLAGRVSDRELDALYRQCSVFVAPSRYESFGLIYVEAMSRGKPVIGCRAGGIPEVIREGKTGLLAAPGDAASLAACMVRLGSDPALRGEYGAAARRDYLERFGADRFAIHSAAYYRTVKRAQGRFPNKVPAQ